MKRLAYVPFLFALACGGGPTTPASPAEIHTRLSARAVVEPRAGTAHVATESSGHVVAIFVETGEQVSVGDELATIDSPLAVAPSPIVAPIAGTVIAIHADVGDDVSRAQGALFEIADTSHVQVRFELEDADAARVMAGAPAHVTTTRGEPIADGTVARIAPAMEPRRIGAGGIESTELVRCGWVEIAAGDALPIGRELEVSIELPATRADVTVPHAALAVEDGRTVVHVPGTFGDRVVVVRVGASDTERAEIIDGIGAGVAVRASL